MLKKIYHYQQCCMATFNTNGVNSMNFAMFVNVLLFFFLTDAIGAIKLNGLDYVILVMLGISGELWGNQNHSVLLRQIPVSEKFAVFNLLVVAPFTFVSITALGLLLIVGIASAGNALFQGMTFAEMVAMSSLADINFWQESALKMLCFLIIWPIVMLIFSYRERKKKISVSVAVIALFCICNWWLAKRLEEYQCYGKRSLREVVQLLPHGRLIIVALVMMAVLVWIYTWRRCLALYRADLKGQKSCKEEKAKPAQAASDKASAIGLIGLLAVAVGLFWGIMTFLVFPNGEKISVVTEDMQDYQKFSVCLDEAGVDPEVYFLDSNQSIFPEDIEEVKVEEYYAAIQGEYGDGWSSLTWERMLVANYTEETYKAEKNRVSALSMTRGEQTNTVLKDTEHFAYEAYIAVYSETRSTYEYALFDDENLRVAYVFLQDSTPYDLDTDFDVKTYGSESKVIPSKTANYEDSGYSIYSFWDSKWRCYEVWWPGKE